MGRSSRRRREGDGRPAERRRAEVPVPEAGQQQPDMITSEVLSAAWEVERQLGRAERERRWMADEASGRWWWMLWANGLDPGMPLPPQNGAPDGGRGPFPEVVPIDWDRWGLLAPLGRRQVPAEVVERCAEVAVSPTRRAELAAVEAMGRAAAERRCRVTAERRAARLLAEGW